jgi:hypothetical protein
VWLADNKKLKPKCLQTIDLNSQISYNCMKEIKGLMDPHSFIAVATRD